MAQFSSDSGVDARRNNDVPRIAQQILRREVNNVARDDAVRNGFFQRVIIHQSAAGEIQQARAGLCYGKQLFIIGMSCFFVQRDMQGDVIAFGNNIFHGILALDRRGKVPGGFQR